MHGAEFRAVKDFAGREDFRKSHRPVRIKRTVSVGLRLQLAVNSQPPSSEYFEILNYHFMY